MRDICISQCGYAVCKGRLIRCHFMLSVESSPVSHYIVWKVFVRNTKPWNLIIWVMYLFMRETEALPLNKLKPCMTPFCADVAYYCFQPCVILYAAWSLMRRIIVTFSPFLSSVKVLHRRKLLPLVGEMGCDTGVVSLRFTGCLGHFALAKPAAHSPFLGGGSRGHRLPAPAGDSAPASHPFPWGLWMLPCSIHLHPRFQR